MSDHLNFREAAERPRPPKADELDLKFSDKAIAELEALASHYPTMKARVLPGLWIAQREYGGHLSKEAIAEVAYRLNRSYAEVEGVATFYTMYNTAHAVGKHSIEVCTCLSCHLCGAYRVADYIKEKLGVEFGETTEDGMFTLHEVECLDACDRAPLLMVGDQYYGPVDEGAIDQLLEKLKAADSSVVKLADEIVQVHLADTEKPK